MIPDITDEEVQQMIDLFSQQENIEFINNTDSNENEKNNQIKNDQSTNFTDPDKFVIKIKEILTLNNKNKTDKKGTVNEDNKLKEKGKGKEKEKEKEEKNQKENQKEKEEEVEEDIQKYTELEMSEAIKEIFPDIIEEEIYDIMLFLMESYQFKIVDFTKRKNIVKENKENETKKNEKKVIENDEEEEDEESQEEEEERGGEEWQDEEENWNNNSQTNNSFLTYDNPFKGYTYKIFNNSFENNTEETETGSKNIVKEQEKTEKQKQSNKENIQSNELKKEIINEKENKKRKINFNDPQNNLFSHEIYFSIGDESLHYQSNSFQQICQAYYRLHQKNIQNLETFNLDKIWNEKLKVKFKRINYQEFLTNNINLRNNNHISKKYSNLYDMKLNYNKSKNNPFLDIIFKDRSNLFKNDFTYNKKKETTKEIEKEIKKEIEIEKEKEIENEKEKEKEIENEKEDLNKEDDDDEDENNNNNQIVYNCFTLLLIIHEMIGNWQILRNLYLSSTEIKKDKSISIFDQAPKISQNYISSQRLISKIRQQFSSSLYSIANVFPNWIEEVFYSDFSRLLPFKLRYYYFQLTSLGILRSINVFQNALDQSSINNYKQKKAMRIPRYKVRFDRETILQSALKIFSIQQIYEESILEIEYFGEKGTGSGPSQEFFYITSLELRNPKLNIWYLPDQNISEQETNVNENKNENEKENEKEKENENGKEKEKEKGGGKEKDSTVKFNPVFSTFGLFPSPINPNEENKETLQLFEFMGSFVARAIMDKRICDLPFCDLFLKYALGESPTISDLTIIRPTLAKTLEQFLGIIQKKENGEKNLKYNNIDIKDLFLNFTLPGYPDIELIENGTNIMVNLDNLKEYVHSVYDHFLSVGIRQQINAFVWGFNKIFEITTLKVFQISEIQNLINGEIEPWDEKLLNEALLFKHGYHSSSFVIKYLIQVLCEFTVEQQILFIRFVTGSPRLPIGGLRNLKPQLTVVKSVNRGKNADNTLPTVMTCHNFLKIPDYSSKEILKKRLLTAITVQCIGFHLS